MILGSGLGILHRLHKGLHSLLIYATIVFDIGSPLLIIEVNCDTPILRLLLLLWLLHFLSLLKL